MGAVASMKQKRLTKQQHSHVLQTSQSTKTPDSQALQAAAPYQCITMRCFLHPDPVIHDLDATYAPQAWGWGDLSLQRQLALAGRSFI